MVSFNNYETQLVLTSMIPFGSVVILATYFSMYVLIETLIYKKRYILFIIILPISVVFFTLLTQVFFYYIIYPKYYPEYLKEIGFFDFNYYYQFVQIYLVVGVASTIKFTRKWIKEQKLKSELEQTNLNSEIALLRSQINPHFLFNTINNIDSLILKDPKKASDSLLRLSDIMRYMLYDANVEKVPVEKEIEYIKSLINLQLLRIENQSFIVFNIEGIFKNIQIAPMIFVPFVENAFKHGDKNVSAPGIHITLKSSMKGIYFEIKNFYNQANQANKDKTGGIGLSVTKRRLELIYPDSHILNIIHHDSIFIVKLKIDL